MCKLAWFSFGQKLLQKSLSRHYSWIGKLEQAQFYPASIIICLAFIPDISWSLKQGYFSQTALLSILKDSVDKLMEKEFSGFTEVKYYCETDHNLLRQFVTEIKSPENSFKISPSSAEFLVPATGYNHNRSKFRILYCTCL